MEETRPGRESDFVIQLARNKVWIGMACYVSDQGIAGEGEGVGERASEVVPHPHQGGHQHCLGVLCQWREGLHQVVQL